MRYSARVRAVVTMSLAGLVLATVPALSVVAQTSESSSYQAVDLQFGTSMSEGCSDEYCAETTLGQVVIGDSANDVMNAQFYDELDDDEPRVEVIIANSSSDMGVLKADRIATKTMAVRVKTNQTSGYSVQLVGDPPKTDTHTLSAFDSPRQVKAGEEGFGVNVVANEVPAIGRSPVLFDSEESQTDAILEPYRQPDRFMYKPGDTIINSLVGTGRVDYVVSMVVAISSDTPPGFYAGTLRAIVVPHI